MTEGCSQAQGCRAAGAASYVNPAAVVVFAAAAAAITLPCTVSFGLFQLLPPYSADLSTPDVVRQQVTAGAVVNPSDAGGAKRGLSIAVSGAM